MTRESLAPMRDNTAAIFGDRYRAERLLAHGAMGEVYQGLDLLLQRRVALKVLRRMPGMDLARFEREARTLAAVSDPHVVTLFDCGVTPRPYLVLEYLYGLSLEATCMQDTLTIPRALRVADQLLTGLDAVHRAGLVHRDIKPANIMLTQTGSLGELVKLVDFGIAKPTRDATMLTGAGELVGTLRYMASEQIMGGAVDERTDLYALGCTLYFALAGQTPFDAPDIGDLILSIVRGERPALMQLRPEVPIGFARAIELSMSVNPDDRFASAVAMREAIRAIAVPRAPSFARLDHDAAEDTAHAPHTVELSL